MRHFRLGTRGSRLALWQASFVARALAGLPHGPDVEVVVLRTKGDAVVDRPLAEVGGSGLFVKELEQALLRREVDLAVHSLKDLETRLPEGLLLAATPARGAVEDCLVAARPVTVDALPRGARVATGSPRREALLRERRPDLRFLPLRGNVPTRLERVLAGEADATVLARAGLQRLGLEGHAVETLDPGRFPPAAGQGALGIECRADDGETREILRLLDDPATRAAVTAERAFLRTLGAGCHMAAGAWARRGPGGGSLRLTGFAGSAKGAELHREERGGPEAEAEALGSAAAAAILERASPALRAELAARA